MKAKAERAAGIHQLSRDEAIVLFDRAARRELNMSGEEFLRALDGGEFQGDLERPQVVSVLMLLPLVRGEF